MNSLLQTLYTYTYENRMMYTTEDRLQYNESCRIAEQARKELLDMLPEEGQQRFEEFLEEEVTKQLLELETMFRAGLAIGLELSHLQ